MRPDPALPTSNFGERQVWSSGPEAFCWEPVPELEVEPEGEALDQESLVSIE